VYSYLESKCFLKDEFPSEFMYIDPNLSVPENSLQDFYAVTGENLTEVNEMAYGNSGGSSYGEREMHKVTCSECKKETEVPFKPTGDRPVYCRDCYQKHKPPRRY
jgi:CxxC-x17-CxxC domain-containing protein